MYPKHGYYWYRDDSKDVQGPAYFRKDQTMETVSCSPWSKRVKPFPPLIKRNTFEEEKKGVNSTFCPDPIQPKKKPTPWKRSGGQRRGGKEKIRRLDKSKFENHKAKIPTSFPLVPATTSTTTTAVTSSSTQTTCTKAMLSMCTQWKTVLFCCPRFWMVRWRLGWRERQSEKERTTEKGERRQIKDGR